MLATAVHLGSMSWQELLLYSVLILVVVAALFGFFWWRQRASRPKAGDFAALVQHDSLRDVLAKQEASPADDAVHAWQQTQQTMNMVETKVELVLSLIMVLLTGLFLLICVAAVLSEAFRFPNVGWGTLLLFLALGAVCVWFMRVKWRDFRASLGRK